MDGGGQSFYRWILSAGLTIFGLVRFEPQVLDRRVTVRDLCLYPLVTCYSGKLVIETDEAQPREFVNS